MSADAVDESVCATSLQGGFRGKAAVPAMCRQKFGFNAEQERIDYLEKKIQTKDEVLAELMAEHIALKKTLGEL
jgi:hypothetical protein